MNKNIKNYLKNTNYSEEGIYKVAPAFLLENFYNWLKANEKIVVEVHKWFAYSKDRRIVINDKDNKNE